MACTPRTPAEAEAWLWENTSGRTLASYQNPDFKASRAPRAAWVVTARLIAVASGFGTMSFVLALIA